MGRLMWQALSRYMQMTGTMHAALQAQDWDVVQPMVRAWHDDQCKFEHHMLQHTLDQSARCRGRGVGRHLSAPGPAMPFTPPQENPSIFDPG